MEGRGRRRGERVETPSGPRAAPALPLLLAMGCDLPAVLASETPVTAIFERLDMPQKEAARRSR